MVESNEITFELVREEYGFDEDGACSSRQLLDTTIQYVPTDYGILDSYEPLKKLYEVPLSPTVITLTECKETHE